MSGSADDAGSAVARIYNSAGAASAIGAAWELGVLDELKDVGALDVRRFAAERKLDEMSTAGLLSALSAVEVVRRDDDRALPGAHFDDVYRTRSLLRWLTGGRVRGPLPTPADRAADDQGRAAHRPETSEFCYDPWFWEAVDGFDFDVRLVADLGCGSGDRILQILRRHPGARAMGIDTLRPALTVAATRVREAGLAHRAAFLEADVRTVEDISEFAEVDLLTCFLMGHEFWPRDRCVDTLQRLRDQFPGTRRFLIGDATRAADSTDQELPLFSLDFELDQDSSAAFLPTVTDWESVFEPGGWRLLRKYWINITFGEVIFELEPL
ncbi:class I SAM-dependent methyltransferase [Streptomyces sp. B6B3]|uniref:class I SAM-dependent methyltransferase n=1 Tax=Streptomyces sp. B6B3 TaxID=3153570 RepID=UPI00325F4C9A